MIGHQIIYSLNLVVKQRMDFSQELYIFQEHTTQLMYIKLARSMRLLSRREVSQLMSVITETPRDDMVIEDGENVYVKFSEVRLCVCCRLSEIITLK